MTVVTALAVSWNPLMNSKANATNRATARKISGPAGKLRAASQKFIKGSVGEPAGQSRERVCPMGYSPPGESGEGIGWSSMNLHDAPGAAGLERADFPRVRGGERV